MPPRVRSKKTFLLVYGQHVSIERLLPMAQFLSNYGAVYIVDNPGFGNMEASYKLGEKPTLDFYDGHMKQVFDEVLPPEEVTVIGISFGFQIVTHFLQSHPIYQQRVKNVVSFVGFTKYSEFHIPKGIFFFFKYVLAGVGKTLLGSLFYRYIVFQTLVLAPIHLMLSPLNSKLHGKSLKFRWQHAKEQVWLWKYNDPRTHAFTGWQFFSSNDLTKERVDLTCHHIYAKDDQYFNNEHVLSNLRQIYSEVKAYTFDIPAHSPVDIEEEYKIAELVPKELTQILEGN